MTRVQYSRDELGGEIQAPWGYYQPLEEGSLEYGSRQVLYTLGSACIEVSCCGHGSWEYARVEGYVVDGGTASPGGDAEGATIELETIESAEQRAEISKLIQEQYPGVRVEFR